MFGGQLIEKQALAPHNQHYTLDMERYDSGLYLVVIEQGELLYRARVVKQE